MRIAGGDVQPAATGHPGELVVVGFVGDAELAARVGAARPEDAARLQRDRESAARRDVDPVGGRAELPRNQRLFTVQTELAADVPAPAPQRAVGLDRHDGAAVDSGRSQEPVVLRADTLRLRYVALSGAVPELAIRVDAPGPEAAILLDGDGVVRTARSEDPAAAGDLGRHFLHRRVSPAELAEPVPPPRPEGPVRLDGQREVVAGTDGHPVVAGAYALERRVLFARDPELAVAVVTGDPERAVGLECDAVSV